jgi:hypothetical protein
MTGAYTPPSVPGGELVAADVTALKSYLDDGGNLWLGSYSVPFTLPALDSAFMANYLHANFTGSTSRKFYLGIEGNPVGDDIMVFGRTTGIAATATLEPVSGGQPAFKWTNSAGTYLDGFPTGVTYEGAYRTAFFAFGAEMLLDEPNEYYDYVVNDSLIARVVKFLARGSATPVEEDPGSGALPAGFALEQNYPNPFNPATDILYSLGAGLPAPTSLSVFNVLGQKVATLVDEVQGPGTYRVTWQGTTDAGVKVASGVYFYRLAHGEQSDTRKMVLVK